MADKKPLYDLYKGLRANNYDVPDNYESFERTLTKAGNEGANNRRTLYQALKQNYYDVLEKYETFYSTLFEPVNRTTSRAKGSYGSASTQKPQAKPTASAKPAAKTQAVPKKTAGKQGTPMTAAQKLAYSNWAGGVVANSNKQHQQFTQKLANIKKGNTLGKTSEVKMNPTTGKMERKYYTTKGDEVGSQWEQSDKNLQYRDEWEATTPEGKASREKRMENDYEDRVGAVMDKFDPDNAAEMAWQSAEERTAADRDKHTDYSFLGNLRGNARELRPVISNMADHLTNHDLQRLADDAWNRLGKQKQQTITNDIAEALHKRYPQATNEQIWQTASQMARQQSDKRMFELAVKKNVPKSATEWFFRKAFGENSLMKLIQATARANAGTTGDMDAREVAEQGYNKGFGRKAAGIAGTVLGFASDPLTWLSAGTGSAAVKGATWLGGKALGEAAMRKAATTLGGRLALAGVGGAANFGFFEAGGEAVEQAKWGGHRDEETGAVGDYSLGAVGKQAVHGLAMGAATGMIAPLVGNVSDKLVRATESTVGKAAIRAGEIGVGTLAEGTIFSIPEWVEGKRDAMDVWTDTMALMAALKLQHGVKSVPKVIAELSRDPKGMKSGMETRARSILDGTRPDLALTKDEIAELKRGGYTDLTQLTEDYGRYVTQKAREAKAKEQKPNTTDPSRMLPEAELPEGLTRDIPVNRFQELMNDGSISEAARAKMYYYLTGRTLPMSTVIGSTVMEDKDDTGNVMGYTVQSYGANGVITSRSFANKKRADVEVNRINRLAELNTIDVGERYFDAAGDSQRLKEACQRVGEDVNAPADSLYELMKRDPDTMNDVEKAWAEMIIGEYNELGDKYSTSAMRSAIKKDYYVDVDEAIKKEPNRRSKQEQEALMVYRNRLFADVKQPQSDASPVALIGSDETPADPMAAAHQRGHEADAQERRDIAIEKSDSDNTAAQEAWNGVVNRINEDADYKAAQERAVAKKMQHTDGTMRPVVMKEVDEEGRNKEAYLVDGNVVMMADGSMVDKTNSDKSVVIYDPSTGERRMVDPGADTGILLVGETISAEEYDAWINSNRDKYVQEQLDEAQGKLRLAPGQQIVLPTGESAVVTAIDGDNITVSMGEGKQTIVQLSELQRISDAKALADYNQRHPKASEPISEDGRGEGQQPVTGEGPEASSASKPAEHVQSGVMEGAPKEFSPDMEVTIHDEDGTDKPAMVMGRVCYEKGEFVPDENGSIIEYYMDGMVLHDHEDKLRDKVVSHVVERAEEPIKENEVQPTEPSVQDNSMESSQQPISDEPRPISDEQLHQYAQDAYHDAMTDNVVSLPQEQVEQMQQRNKQMLDAENARREAEAHREPTALERIPVDDKTGEPMFEKADRETALAALGELTGGSEANTEAIVNAQATQANKELEALRKKQPTRKAPKLSGSPMAMIKAQQVADAQYNVAMEQYNAMVAAATEKAKAWDGIAATMRQKQRAAQERLKAERKAADAKRHQEAMAQVEEQKRIVAEKAAEQAEVGTHAVNPKIREKWDGVAKVEGNANAITLADGSTIRGHYVLTEAGAASASHDVNNAFEPTEGFPIDENGESVNDRDYKRDTDAQRIVRDIARNYDSRALQSPVIVSKDGIVLSGNNRTMSGDIAATQGTDKAYIDHLREFGQMYGFTPEQIESMKHPRVVFVPDEAMPYDATTFARFNAEQQKKQGKDAQAVKLGKVVPDNVFNSIVGDISRYDRLSDFYADDKAVASAISQLLGAGVINEMQLPEMRTGNALSAAGRELIENTLIGKVFQTSPDAVRQIISTPTLRHAVIMGLNEIAHNRTLAKSGYDLSQELGAAVDLVARAKAEAPDIYKEGMPVSPYGRQAGLFDDEYGDSRVTDATVLLLADVLNSGKPSDLRKMLATYNNEAQAAASGQIDMFSGDVRSKEQLLNDVNEYFRNATPKEQQAIVDAAVAERKQRAEANAQVADGTGRNGNGEPNTEVRNGDDVGDGRQNGSEEAYTDKITPVGESDFGFVYDQFKGNAQGAIQQLMKMQDGEALGALHHTEIGDIDLVWGKAGTRKSDGYGLAKLVKFHPEVLDNLQGILDSMHVTKRSENRVQLENDEYQAAVRLTWNGDEKLWLLTAFKKKETSEPTNSRTDVDSNLDGKSDDTATRQSSDVSANKGIDNQSDLQENNEKTSVNEEGIDWSTREESPRNEAEWMDMMRFEYDGNPVPEEKDMRSMKRFIDNVLSEDRGIDETTSEHTATTERMAEIPATRLYNSEAAWFSHKKYGDSIAFFDEGEKAVYKLSAQRDKRGYIARVILTRETFAKEGKTLSEQKDMAVEGKSSPLSQRRTPTRRIRPRRCTL